MQKVKSIIRLSHMEIVGRREREIPHSRFLIPLKNCTPYRFLDPSNKTSPEQL